MGAASTQARRIAVAPYFLYRLDVGTTFSEAIQAAFEENDQLLRTQAETARQQGKRLSVYEENFHTTLGSAPPELRDKVVTGAASGPALARRLIQGTLSGVKEQAVYSFAGFDSYLQEGKGLVRLWGITRDLAEAQRFRPTGIALKLLNRVAGGSVRNVRCAGSECASLTAVLFGDDQRLAVVSANALPKQLELALPCPSGQLQMDLLDGSQPELNNEQTTQVQVKSELLVCKNSRVKFTLPAYSLAVVYP